MPAFRKTSLSLALGVALGSVALVPSLATAFAPNVSNGVIATDDRGDTLIGPMYSTVKDPTGGGPIFDAGGNIIGTAPLSAITSFSIINSDPTNAVLVKVRFREQLRSMEALDFMVLLSPDDQFSWFMNQDGNVGSGQPTTPNPAPGTGGERPWVQWQDDTCVIGGPIRTIQPRSGADGTEPPILRTYFPTTVGNPFITSVTDLSFGHVEVIGMAAFPPGHPMNVASQAKGAGMDAVCQGVRNNLATRLAAETALQQSIDVPNVLTGRFVVSASGAGVEYGDDFIALRNSFAVPYIAPQNNEACTPDPFIGAGFGGMYANLHNYLSPAATPLPPPAAAPTNGAFCHSLYAWDNAESAHPHLGDMNIPFYVGGAPQVARLDGLTVAHALSGDWSNNGPNNVSTDQIITFFDKYVYTDFVNCQGGAEREWCKVNYEAQSNPLVNTAQTGPIVTNAAPDGRRDLVVGRNGETAEGTPFGMESLYINPALFDPATSLCMLGNEIYMWDIDEREVVINSPGPDGELPLCPETLVMSLLEGDNGGSAVFPSLIQYQNKRIVVTYAPFDTDFVTNRGIFELWFNWSPTLTWAPNAYGAGIGTTEYLGAATSGLLAIQRRTEGPEINNGSLTSLGRSTFDFLPGQLSITPDLGNSYNPFKKN